MNRIFLLLALGTSACNYGLVDHDRSGGNVEEPADQGSDDGVEVTEVEDTGSTGSDDTGTAPTATIVCYWDADNDGAGNGNVSDVFEGTECPVDWSSSGDDCDEGDASVHPGATEICGDGIDQDCSGADEVCAEAGTDADGDGYTVEAGDCDDNDASVHADCEEVDVDLTREVCVTRSTSAYRLAYEDLGTSDRTHWTGYDSSSGEGYVTSPILTGSAGGTGCVNVTLTRASVTLKFNGVGDDAEIWGDYLVGETWDGASYCDSSDGLSAEVRVTVDGEEADFCPDSNDLCWTD